MFSFYSERFNPKYQISSVEKFIKCFLIKFKTYARIKDCLCLVGTSLIMIICLLEKAMLLGRKVPGPKDEVISKLFNVFGNIESCRRTTISNITK